MAATQHGVVTRAQLLSAGISAAEIRARLRSGALLREHPRVYRVGHRAPSVEARYLAAVLACGEGALLSGRAAGRLLGLLDVRAPVPKVLTPTERRIKGIVTCRSRRIDPLDATIWLAIPVTTVARTLVDLAGELSLDALARACHEAGVRYHTTPREVEAVLARRPSSRGARTLREVLGGEGRVTLSALERRFLRLIREAGLPLPQTNRPAGSRRVDCRWPDERLTVELDSFRYHNSRYAWERDRLREREARDRGDAFRRYTYEDVLSAPGPVLAELGRLLSGSRPG